MASEQKKVVLAGIDTIIKFLRNEESYIPFRATVVGYGGTGKSYIINTILTIVRKLTKKIQPFWLELHQEQQLKMFRDQLCIIYLAYKFLGLKTTSPKRLMTNC